MKKEFKSAASKMTRTPDGTRRWYLGSDLHREDGPAYEGIDGTEHWYRHGKLHRDDGPAIIEPDGSKYWYFNGVQTTATQLAVQVKQREQAEKARARAEVQARVDQISSREQQSAEELRRRLRQKAEKSPRIGKK